MPGVVQDRHKLWLVWVVPGSDQARAIDIITKANEWIDEMLANMDQEKERVRTKRNQYGPNPWLEHTGWERHLSSDHKVVTNTLVNAEAELLKLEMEEETRIRKDPDIVIDEDLETDENSDWLRACNWALWFKHKPIPLFVAAASVPFQGCPGVLYLGKWHGLEFTSPISVERTLQLVAFASQAAIDRCVSTLSKTPRTLRCWARTWGQSFSPYPLECPQPSSLRKYSRIWTSAICYSFRVWDQGRRLKESTADLCGINFTDQASRNATRLVSSRAFGIS